MSGVVPATVSSLALEERTTALFVEAGDSSAARYRLVDFPGHHRLCRAPFRALSSYFPALKCIVVVVDATDSRGQYLRDVAECVSCCSVRCLTERERESVCVGAQAPST